MELSTPGQKRICRLNWDRYSDQWAWQQDDVITPGYIEELDDEGRLRNNEYLHYEVTDKECDEMGEMCDPYEGL